MTNTGAITSAWRQTKSSRNAAASTGGKMCINPRIVLDDSGAPLFAVTLDAVREYLDTHTGEHRTT